MNLADTLRRARELVLSREHVLIRAEPPLYDWHGLLHAAAGEDAPTVLAAMELLDQCTPGDKWKHGGFFVAWADGVHYEWEGDWIIGRLGASPRRLPEIAAVIGRACVLAELQERA